MKNRLKSVPKRARAKQADYDSDGEPKAKLKKRRKKQITEDTKPELEEVNNGEDWAITADDLGDLSDNDMIESYNNKKRDRKRAQLRKSLEVNDEEEDDEEEKPKKKGRKRKGETKPGEKKKRRRKNLPPELIVELYDENLVALKFLGFYNENMKNIIKNRRSTCYDSERKLWVVTIKDYKDILDELKEYIAKEKAKLQDIPEFVTKLMKIDRPFQECCESVDVIYDYSQDKKVSWMAH